MMTIKKGILFNLALTVFVVSCSVVNVFGFANVVSLKVASGTYSDETVIRLENQSTFDFDSNWDAYKFTNQGSTPNFYTLLSNTMYSINSVPMTFQQYDFDLDLQVAFDGTYTITSTSLLNSLDDSLEIILEDKLMQRTMVLSDSSVYEFDAAMADLSDRFVLHYKFIPSTPSAPFVQAAKNTDNDNIDVKVLPDMVVEVNLKEGSSDDAAIYILDSGGKIIYGNEEVLANSTTDIFLPRNSGSMYFIRVISGDESVCKKIFF